jgi:hypothetical protein
MSRTFRKDERTGRRPEDARRNKRREKANSHYDNIADDYKKWCDERGQRNSNRYYDLDTDTD